MGRPTPDGGPGGPNGPDGGIDGDIGPVLEIKPIKEPIFDPPIENGPRDDFGDQNNPLDPKVPARDVLFASENTWLTPSFWGEDPTLVTQSQSSLEKYLAGFDSTAIAERQVMWKNQGYTNLSYFGFENLSQPFQISSMNPREESAKWLFGQPTRTIALFGRELSATDKRLRFGDEVRLNAVDNADAVNHVFVRYQQFHDNFPVYGGTVVTRLTNESKAIATVNSFLPLDENAVKFIAPRISSSDAFAKAEAALTAFLSKRGQLRLARLKEEFDKAETSAGVVSGGTEARATLEEAIAKLPASPDKWQTSIAPYESGEEKSDLMVLPHHDVTRAQHLHGDYYLVYRVYLTARHQSWRVFIDAETGEMVGEPDDLLMHLRVPASSAGGLTKPVGMAELNTIQTELNQVATMSINIAIPGAQSPVTTLTNALQVADGPVTPPATQGKQLADAICVAHHAAAFIKYFTGKCGADKSKLISNNPSILRIGETNNTGNPQDDELAVYFDPSDQTINFQTQ